MRAKTFDCAQMRREGAELVRKQLEGRSFEERSEHWRKGTEELKKIQNTGKRRRPFAHKRQRIESSFIPLGEDVPT